MEANIYFSKVKLYCIYFIISLLIFHDNIINYSYIILVIVLL